ncbi:phage antirepressor [Olsenella phocaeensis]|uniref:phage antirepressor n=1 Tax=Olsenella phocaeensis TaxID=1852385 RepID=UPI000930551C|nr:phage antirepressor KilAC domain-containing protein [Olsenella phocaeensis]
MSDEIVPQVFNNPEFGEIRITRGEYGEPWFVAKDVCEAIGITNRSRSMQLLDDDEKGCTHMDTPGGVQNLATVNEAGFYKLILTFVPSKANNETPEQSATRKEKEDRVKRFQRWVTHEVLPAIRRDGGYMVARDETPEETMARAVLLAQRTIERQKAQIEEMRPKALFADAVSASDGTCLVGELAKMLTQSGFTIGQNRLFKLLRDDGFLGKRGSNRNVPLQRYVEQGLFRIKETAVAHSDGHVTINRTTKVTGRGQAYFVKRYSEGVDER